MTFHILRTFDGSSPAPMQQAKRKAPPFFQLGRGFLRFLISAQFDAPTIDGPLVPQRGGGVVLATHFGRFGDPALIQMLIGSRTDVKIVAWAGIGSGFWVEQAQMVLIPNEFREGNLKGVRETFRKLSELAQHIADGGVVVIFPEGMCSGERVLLEFQKGVSHMIATAMQLGADPFLYLSGISYERFFFPRGQSITIRNEVYGVSDEMKELFRTKKSEAMELLTSELEARVANLAILSPVQGLGEVEDGIGALYRELYPSASSRMTTVVGHVARVAEELPQDELAQITEKVKGYMTTCDSLRIPFGSELVPPANPRSLGNLIYLATVGVVVYLGYVLHRVPLGWVEEEVRSGKSEAKWQIEQMLFSWARQFGLWYRNVAMGTAIVSVAALFPVVGLTAVPLAIALAVAAVVVYLNLGLLTIRNYRAVNVARLWAFPTKRFAQHVTATKTLYTQIEALRNQE